MIGETGERKSAVATPDGKSRKKKKKKKWWTVMVHHFLRRNWLNKIKLDWHKIFAVSESESVTSVSSVSKVYQVC